MTKKVTLAVALSAALSCISGCGTPIGLGESRAADRAVSKPTAAALARAADATVATPEAELEEATTRTATPITDFLRNPTASRKRDERQIITRKLQRPSDLIQPTRVCTARETTPAVYEHVMGDVQVVQAEIDENGTVIRPPVYRRAPVPKIVKPRGEVTFDAPCPEDMTPEFITSLQRALAARGYYLGPPTGAFDALTNDAIGRYQKERGLNSLQLSMETARSLGLIAQERS